MGTKPKKVWYGVRTLYRITAEGTPKSRDKHFDPEATLIEDRVVLFRASGFDDAIAQAVKEARAYCRQTNYDNAYGQRVRVRFLDASCNAYEICEMTGGPPAAGWEVYSLTGTVPESVSDPTVIRRRMGSKGSLAPKGRLKFLNFGIVRKALAAAASRSNPGNR